MGTAAWDRQAMRIKACATTYPALIILLLLSTSLAHASPPSSAEVAPTIRVDAELVGSIAQYYLSGYSVINDAAGQSPGNLGAGDEFGNETFPAPGALAGGASTTGGLDSGGPERAWSMSRTSTTIAVLDPSFSSRVSTSSRATAQLAWDNALTTLGAGSRLFSSSIPAAPVGSTTMSGSLGAVGVLTLLISNVGSAGPCRPPLPPYGRRATWTYRAPSTRPG